MGGGGPKRLLAMRDRRLDDTVSLEAPEVIAAEIIDDLQTAMDQMSQIYADLGKAE